MEKHLIPRMAISFVTAVAVIALFVTWYAVSLRRKREKAREILRWIQASLAGRGHVVGISWTTASRFRVPLRLTCGVFRTRLGAGGDTNAGNSGAMVDPSKSAARAK